MESAADLPSPIQVTEMKLNTLQCIRQKHTISVLVMKELWTSGSVLESSWRAVNQV